jgi:hypothetical protein
MQPDDGHMTETCCGNDIRKEKKNHCVDGPLIAELIQRKLTIQRNISLPSKVTSLYIRMMAGVTIRMFPQVR